MAMFEPTRLSVALRRRGMTQRDLATKCDVTSQYISQIERGIDLPPVDMCHKMADSLGFPLAFFFDIPIELVPEAALTFRARRGMESRTRDVGLGTGDIAASVIDADIERRFSLPKAELPDLDSHQPEEAADLLRSYWNLGYEPVQNMVHLLESKGVRVFWIRHESPSLDAFSFWRETKVFVVLNLLKDAGDRARFDAAHELGHLVLHRHLEAQTMGGKAIEKEADRFAAAFLLPAESFTEECPEYPDLGRLYALKARWKVSVAAMIMRGSQLGLFSEWQTRQAFKKMNALGMLRTEKVRIQREQSRLHKMIFSALADKNVSPAAYASSLHLNLTELEELMPIAREFVQQKQEQSVTVPRALNTPRVHLRVIRGGKENRAVN